MTTTHLLLSEIRYRPLNFALSLLAVVVAATLFVAGPTLIAGNAEDMNHRLTIMQQETDKTLAAMDKQTKRTMRDLGFNVMIVHKDTDMIDFYGRFKAVDMPLEYVNRLAQSPDLTKVRHLVATLQQKITWNERQVLLVGILPEVVQTHLDKKPPMGYSIKPGTVLLGHELRQAHEKGQTIQVNQRSFKIARILPLKGNIEDIMIAMHLKDAQEVLGKPDKISQILALGCKCKLDRLGEIRQQLMKILPDTKVTEDSTKAIARGEQRKTVAEESKQARAQLEAARGDVQRKMEGLIGVVVPLVILTSAIFVGLMSWTNVRQRRPEIGLLRALGKGAGQIAALFLGRAILLGLAGGLVGCLAGDAIAHIIGSRLDVAAKFFQPGYMLLISTLLGAPLIAAMATYLPMLSAIRQDPAIVLQDP